VLIVADLQLENRYGYATSDRQQILLRLVEVIDRYEPATLIALGSLHDPGGAERIHTDNVENLRLTVCKRTRIGFGSLTILTRA
jgi:metallophosphoesterase superfamily enzyme